MLALQAGVLRVSVQSDEVGNHQYAVARRLTRLGVQLIPLGEQLCTFVRCRFVIVLLDSPLREFFDVAWHGVRCVALGAAEMEPAFAAIRTRSHLNLTELLTIRHHELVEVVRLSDFENIRFVNNASLLVDGVSCLTVRIEQLFHTPHLSVFNIAVRILADDIGNLVARFVDFTSVERGVRLESFECAGGSHFLLVEQVHVRIVV